MARKRRGRPVNGIIILDKPQGETSNRSLQNVKFLLNAAKAGHTGSLDPLATGVLPLCFGEATKISQFLLESDKAYEATIRLGIKTDSGDSEGAVIQTQDPAHITQSDVEKALKNFRGQVEQIPSMYSALKHKGVPLYKLARAGKTVERKVRVITIYELKLLEFNNPDIRISVSCSKGTYIRTIADDLGEALGVYGHITALRRTKAGPFTLEQSSTFEELKTMREGDDFSILEQQLIPADLAINDMPRVDMPQITADFIFQGQPVIISHLPTEGLVRMYCEDEFIGIGEILEDGRLKTNRLISPKIPPQPQ